MSLSYPASHWGGGSVGLTGVHPSGSQLTTSGWWYRLDGDTRERPLPAPSSESYSGGYLQAFWNLGGVFLSENTYVFDTEDPSGGFVTHMLAVNQSPTPRTLTLFHFLDPDLGNSSGGDHADLKSSHQIAMADLGPEPNVYAVYKAWRSTHYGAGEYPGALPLLNDATLTDLDDQGFPYAGGDFTAAFEFGPTPLPPCNGCLAQPVAMVSFGIASPRDQQSVKGDLRGVLLQSPLLVQRDDLSERYALWMRRTAQVFLPNSIDRLPAPTPTASLVSAADFDGDGASEAVFRDTTTGVTYVGEQAISGAPTLPLNWKLSATGDFNQDGKADIMWRNTTSQKLVAWTMNGAAKTGALVPNPDQAANANWELVGTEDFNEDDKRDLLWYNQTTGKIVLWHMDNGLIRSNGLFTLPDGVGSNTWRVVAVGDYGKGLGGVSRTPDIVWQNEVSRKVVVWHMDSNATRTSGVFTTPELLSGGSGRVVGPR